MPRAPSYIHCPGGTPTLGAIVKLLVIGYSVGIGVIFVPSLLVILVSVDTAPPDWYLMFPLAFLIIPLQGLLISLITYSGLWLFSRYRPILIET